MLMGILGPKWSGDIARFAEYLREWEVAVSSYEDQASSKLDPAVKCATVLHHAPKEVRRVFEVLSGYAGG